MRGKYSPTVSAAYAKDQKWWSKYSREAEKWTQYDPDGYDSYGYDRNDIDRAGNHESVYYCDDVDSYGESVGFNWRYDQAIMDWGFDGEKPVKKN